MSLEDQKNASRLKNFQPNPPDPVLEKDQEFGWQERFIRSSAQTRLLPAGNQSGKTKVGTYEHCCYALGEHPYKKIRTPNTGIIVTAKSFSDGIQNEIIPSILDTAGSRDIVDMKKAPNGIFNRIYWRGGSVTFLMSAEQDDVAFESKTFDHAWIDEPVRRQIYIGLRRGLMKSGGHIWLTATLLEEPWIYEELYLSAFMGHQDIAVFEGSTDSNIHIPKKEQAKFFASLTEDEVQTRRYGKPASMAGRVFKEYDPIRHRIDPFDVPYHWPVYVAIDPHPRKPHAVIYVACGPNEFYVCNEIYMHGDAETLADQMKLLDVQYRVVDRLIDTSAQEEKQWNKGSFRQDLQDCGIRTRLAQKKNKKKSGILKFNSLLKRDKLYVFHNCVRLHRELTMQVYERHKDHHRILEEPQKKFDDATDCVRYILSENPSFHGGAVIQQRDAPYMRA